MPRMRLGLAWLAYLAGKVLPYVPFTWAYRPYQWLMQKSSELDTKQKIWTPVEKVEDD